MKKYALTLLFAFVLLACKGQPLSPLAFQAVGQSGDLYQSHTYGALGSDGKAAYRLNVSGDLSKARATLRVTSQSGGITVKARPDTWTGSLSSSVCKPIHSEPVPTCELIISPLESEKYDIALAGESTGRDFYLFVSIQGASPLDRGTVP